MLYSKSIKGFTLTETLVSMVIMIFVIGIAMSIYTILSTNVRAISNTLNGRTALNNLELQLTADVARYPTITATSIGLQLASPIDTVEYKVIKTTTSLNQELLYVVREKDTLTRQPFIMNTFANGTLTNTGTVDAVKITDPSNGWFIFVYKPIDVRSLMTRDGF